MKRRLVLKSCDQRMLIEEISILPKVKKSKRLLSIFRNGLIVAGGWNATKLLLQLTYEDG